jgi:hypothetical protein
MLSRKQFFARMRKIGFSKSRMQMTRMGLTYRNDDGVTVTVPKGHEQTFHILGDVPYSGIFVQNIGKQTNWGIPVDPPSLGLDNMLEVCLGLCTGEIIFGTAAPVDEE